MPDWLKNAVFYEIYPQSFYDSNGDGIGDISGIIQKLDYVKSLGCSAVWLNPCFDSPFMDAGYDVRDYKKVAPRYGTNEDLKNLFRAAHAKGIRVVLDLVPGHTSEEHKWFQKSRLAESGPYTNRYIWTKDVWDVPEKYHFVTGRAQRNGNYMVNFFSMQPALNYGFCKVTENWQLPYTHPDCLATREAIKDVMRFWLDAGCDGFRVDMAASLVKNDPEKKATSEIWRDIRNMLDRDYPQAALISEWSDPQKALKAGFHCDFYLDHKGNGYNSLMRNMDEATDEDCSFFSSNGKGDIQMFLDDYLPAYNATKEDGYISFITCNHDTPRLGGRFDETELKLAYAFLFTMPGVPFLYYGDEIGMKYQKDLVSKEGGYNRTGTRTPMQWDRGRNAGFSSAPAEKLYLPVDTAPGAPDVKSQAERRDSLLQTVRQVIRLRRGNTDLQSDGPFAVLYAESGKFPFVYRRGRFVIAVNPSRKEVCAPVRCEGAVVFSVGGKAAVGSEIRMAPQSFAVVQELG